MALVLGEMLVSGVQRKDSALLCSTRAHQDRPLSYITLPGLPSAPPVGVWFSVCSSLLFPPLLICFVY